MNENTNQDPVITRDPTQQHNPGQQPNVAQQPYPGQQPYPFAGQQPGAYPPPAQGPYVYTGQGQRVPPPCEPRRTRFQADRVDLIFAAFSAAATLFGVIAGLWGGFRHGYAAAFTVMFIAVSAYLMRQKKNPGVFGALCGLLALGTAGVFVTTENGTIRFAGVLCGMGLSAIWFAALAGVRAPAGELGLPRLIADSALNAPLNAAPAMRAVFSGDTPRRRGLSRAMLGVLCAVPVLAAVIPLLIRSDAAFEGMVGSVFKNFGTVAAQVIVSLLLIPLILSFAFSLRKEPKTYEEARAGKGLDPIFLCAFLTALGVVYLFYLFSQLAYFFDAFRGLLPSGYENAHAEYARRGFFELCGVAGINLAILFLTVVLSRKKEEKLPGALRGLGTFLVLFTLVLIGTAFSKMALYIGAYGMTVLRLGTSAFMAFMAVVFLALLLRLFTPKARVLHVAALAAGAVVLILGLCNIDGFVAKYNYDAYADGRLTEIDAEYLTELGPDGTPYLLRLYENAKDEKERIFYEQKILRICESLYVCDYRDVSPEEAKELGLSFDGFRIVFETPLKAAHAGLFNTNLPLSRAYAALHAFLAERPDFLENAAAREYTEWNDPV